MDKKQIIKDQMTFNDIRENKETFLSLYDVKKEFETGKISWEELIKIGEDFEKKRNREYFQIIQKYIAQISTFSHVHSYRYRIKKTNSLLAKIIRKSAKRSTKITLNNYFREISDLLGIRILYVFKEDYWPIHKQIMDVYNNRLVEHVCLKLKSGDDQKLYSKMLGSYNNIKVEENELYRSIHYTLNATDDMINQPKLEIQTRTIFEEGWSEINHMLVYKQNIDSIDLQIASGVLSDLVGSCDNIGQLMKHIYDDSAKIDLKKNNKCSIPSTEEEHAIASIIEKFLME